MKKLLPLLLLAVAQLSCGSEAGSALCEAIYATEVEAVEALLAEGADPNENVTFQGQVTQPMRLALMRLSAPTEESEAIALAVIAAGGNPNLAWSYGDSSEGSSGNTMYALEVVARGGSVRALDAFLKAGARVEGEPGGQALIAAARADEVDVLRILVEAGAEMNYQTRTGDTPLGAAVRAGARKAIVFLDEQGASEW